MRCSRTQEWNTFSALAQHERLEMIPMEQPKTLVELLNMEFPASKTINIEYETDDEEAADSGATSDTLPQ